MRLILTLLLTCMVAHSASVTLAWDPNSEPDVAGYRIYYGKNGMFTTVINVGNTTNCVISELINGTSYSFYATCYNTSGLESEPSNIVVYTVPEPNPVPNSITDISIEPYYAEPN